MNARCVFEGKESLQSDPLRRGSLPDFFNRRVLLESFAEVLHPSGCNLILDKPKKKALHVKLACKPFHSTRTA